MKYNNRNLKPVLPEVRMARVKQMFDSVRFDTVKVIVGSEEDIFEETFVTAIVGVNRVVKLKKSVLEYL
jgi:hypothetical protein